MLIAHDIRSILNNLPMLTITANTTEEEAGAAFPQLASVDEGGVFVGQFSGQSPWERHPSGDKLLHILDGEMEITVLTTDGPVGVTVRAGSIFVVPRGLWHRQLASKKVTELSVTPKPSEVSFAEDPRHEG